MQSVLTRADYEEIYRWFDLATPLEFDCGQLCNKKCCSEWEQGVGMYLFPGEDAMFSGDEDWLIYAQHSTDDYEFCPEWDGKLTFIVCTRPCPREQRPVECRSFPLTPHLTTEGELEFRLDDDGLHLCPLVQRGQVAQLDQRFVYGVRRAWEIMLKDPLIHADVKWRSRLREVEENAPWKKLLRR